jgi:DNA-binding transcriptional MerR regulator
MYTVGELAEIAGVTVRTIQYYDNIHLLAAKRKTNKNSRFYTKNDLVKL